MDIRSARDTAAVVLIAVPNCSIATAPYALAKLQLDVAITTGAAEFLHLGW
jgi:hypothetical protein